jgi:hypothetical protein
MRPSCNLYPYFDDIPISEYCYVGTNTEPISVTGAVSDANGYSPEITFVLPSETFLVGEKIIKLIDNPNNQMKLVTTSAEAQFTAAGAVLSTSNISVCTRPVKLVKPTTKDERIVFNSSVEVGNYMGSGAGGRADKTTTWKPYPSGTRPGVKPCPRPMWNNPDWARPGAYLNDSCGIVQSSVRNQITLTAGKQVRTGNRFDAVMPLAQTFSVSSGEHPDGVYITKVNVWFKEKGTMPVTLQIRPVVNGEVHPSVVLPFSETVLSASSIKVNSEVPSYQDTQTQTTFDMSSPVHLVPGQEYALVFVTNDISYTLYGSVVGQTNLATEEVITKPAFGGSLFYQKPIQNNDSHENNSIMHGIYYAQFDNTSTYDVVFQENKTPADYTGTQGIDLFNITCSVIEHATTEIDWSINTTPNTQEGVIGNTFSRIDVNTNNKLSSGIKVEPTKEPASLQIKSEFRTDNPDVSPMIDRERISLVGVRNIIDNNSDTLSTSSAYNGELDASGHLSEQTSTSRARYISRIVRLEESMEVFAKLQMPSDDKPFDKVSWQQLTSLTPKYISENDIVYNELEFKLSEDMLEPFSKYSIKVCMYSSSSTMVPTIKDMRAIAVL